MAIAIDVDTNIADVQRRLAEAGRQWPFATANALTKLGHQVNAALKAEMSRAFDRPRPYTLNAFKVDGATKQNQIATVSLKAGSRSWRGYLETEAGMTGGTRQNRVSEDMLAAKFGSLAAAVPGRGARKDTYGNWVKAERSKAITDVMSQPTRRTPGKAKGRNREFFVPEAGSDLPAGIYVRQGEAIRRLVTFTRSEPRYRKRFNFAEVAASTVRSGFAAAFREVLTRIMGRA